jgi:multicomponent Na+:H+ antiporter subunit B
MFLVAGCVVAVGFVLAFLRLPPFGTLNHPYGARAVATALGRSTANAVSSVNFDQRALDTLVEESILFAAVVGSVVLLRQARDERRGPPAPAHVLPPVNLFGAVLLPVTLLTGVYLVAHGAISPGGGFQGGVVLATGLHVAYLAADYRVLHRLRPLALLDIADAVGAGAFTALGFAGLLAGVAYLANVLPFGQLGQLASGGLVPVLNAAVGLEVGCGVMVLLAQFLDQAVEINSGRRGASG